MPSNLTGLVILLFAAVPGYLYLVRYEGRALRERPGAAREIAELFSVGAFVTLGAAALVFALAEVVPGLATLEGTASGGAYLRTHAWDAARSGALALVVSSVVCAALGEFRGRRHGGGVVGTLPGTVWSALLRTGPGEDDPEAEVFMDDGTVVTGRCHMVSSETDTSFRDVALHEPISVRAPGEATAQASPAHYVIVPGARILFIRLTVLRKEEET
jgi:hypothetical protein